MNLFRKKSKDFASIYFYDERAYILSLFDSIEGGPLTLCPPFEVIDIDFSKIPKSVLKSLNSDKSSNRNRIYEDLIQEFLEFSGFKSLKSFENKSKMILIEKIGTTFMITPTKSGSKGFEEDLENQLQTKSEDDIARLLQNAYNLCK